MECYALRLGICNCTQLNILAPLFKQEFIIVSFTTNNNIMSQGDIDDFIKSVQYGTTTPTCVITAVVLRGIPVNGRNSAWNVTALHYAVRFKCRELVVALLAAGANPNVTDVSGSTSVLWAASSSIADILQLVIHGGGSVNEADNVGWTPLIALARSRLGNAATRLQVLLRCPELDLDAACDGTTAEEWAVRMAHF
jgi:ankyrin repeat protein